MKLASKIFKRDDWYVTSSYGKRKPIITKNGISSSFHYGCDYGTNKSEWPQYAIENGIVMDCGISSDGAKYIWVYYPRIQKKLLHYHLSSICVQKSQAVTENTLLGYTGKTGRATGIHLHLGMKDIYNNYEDPHSYEYKVDDKKEITYIVQKDDNLSKIAKKYNTTWKKIYQDNKIIIGDNPNKIYEGQILKIK